MTVSTMELAPSLQALVDARLDNIDRALLGGSMSRGERRQIVSSVEEQIYELLERLDTEEPTREQLLQILAALDPPEAYASFDPVRLAEPRAAGARAAAVRLPRGQSVQEGTDATTHRRRVNVLAVVSVVLGGFAVLSGLTFFVLGIFGLFFLLAFSLGALTCGIVATCQIVAARGAQSGMWMGITGICSPFLAAVCSIVAYWLLVLSG